MNKEEYIQSIIELINQLDENNLRYLYAYITGYFDIGAK